MDVQIDGERFFQRLARLKSHWLANKSGIYGGADALCVHMGVVDDLDAMVYSKASAAHLFLLGYEFPDSIILLTQNVFYFFATSKKCSYLQAAVDANKNDEIKVQYLNKSKDPTQNNENFGKLLGTIKQGGGSKIGILMKGEVAGSFITAWMESVENSKLTKIDISAALGLCLSIKDESEQVFIIFLFLFLSNESTTHIVLICRNPASEQLF